MHKFEQTDPSPERQPTRDEGWLKRLIGSRALKHSNETDTQAPETSQPTSPREFKIDFHGDPLIIEDAIIRQSRPSRPHLTFFDERTNQYVYAKLSDIKIEFQGELMSYTRFVKLRGSPIAY